MFENIRRRDFKIDTVFPAIQTASAFAVTQLLGRLGHYTVNSRSTVLLAAVMATVAELAKHIFKQAWAYYVALPVGLLAGLAVHRFFYPLTAVQQVINAKGIIVLLAVLTAVKLIADNLHRLRREAAEVEAEIRRPAKKDVTVDAPANA